MKHTVQRIREGRYRIVILLPMTERGTDAANLTVNQLLEATPLHTDKVCPSCKGLFTVSHNGQIYCTPKCAHRERQNRYQQAKRARKAAEI